MELVADDVNELLVAEVAVVLAEVEVVVLLHVVVLVHVVLVLLSVLVDVAVAVLLVGAFGGTTCSC